MAQKTPEPKKMEPSMISPTIEVEGIPMKASILSALQKAKITTISRLSKDVISNLTLKYDLIVEERTLEERRLSYLIAALECIDVEQLYLQVILITSKRDLARESYAILSDLTEDMKIKIWLCEDTLSLPSSSYPLLNNNEIPSSCQLIVCTDTFLKQGKLYLDTVKLCILDDCAILSQQKEQLLKALPKKRVNLQYAFFSEKLGSDILKTIDTYLTDRTRVVIQTTGSNGEYNRVQTTPNQLNNDKIKNRSEHSSRSEDSSDESISRHQDYESAVSEEEEEEEEDRNKEKIERNLEKNKKMTPPSSKNRRDYSNSPNLNSNSNPNPNPKSNPTNGKKDKNKNHEHNKHDNNDRDHRSDHYQNVEKYTLDIESLNTRQLKDRLKRMCEENRELQTENKILQTEYKMLQDENKMLWEENATFRSQLQSQNSSRGENNSFASNNSKPFETHRRDKLNPYQKSDRNKNMRWSPQDVNDKKRSVKNKSFNNGYHWSGSKGRYKFYCLTKRNSAHDCEWCSGITDYLCEFDNKYYCHWRVLALEGKRPDEIKAWFKCINGRKYLLHPGWDKFAFHDRKGKLQVHPFSDSNKYKVYWHTLVEGYLLKNRQFLTKEQYKNEPIECECIQVRVDIAPQRH